MKIWFAPEHIRTENERSVKAKKNIVWLMIFKVASAGINLALVPLSIRYVDASQYGIWLTLSSIVWWFSIFDIGFGNGLRNRFAKSKAIGDIQKIKIYISTTYFSLVFIFLSVCIALSILTELVSWSDILNISTSQAKGIDKVVILFLSFFCLQNILKVINTILVADQQPSKAALIDLIGQSMSMVIIYIMVLYTKGSLLMLAIAIGLAPIIVSSVATITLFKKKYIQYCPSIKHIKIEYFKDLVGLGFQFFIIQFSIIILYQTNNILIIHTGRPVDVTIYNIALKYFNISLILSSIIYSPFWSAYTDAYTKGDFLWMNRIFKILLGVFVGIIVLVFLQVVFAEVFFNIWIGSQISIPKNISIMVAILITLLSLITLSRQLLSGMGKTLIQMICSIGTLLHIPLGLLLGDRFGLKGIICSAIIICTVVACVCVSQLSLILSQKSHGIWNR